VTDDGILMRLALDEASAAADRGDPGFGAVVARVGQTVAERAVRRSPIAIRSPTTASPSPRGVPSAGQEQPQRLHVLWHRRTLSNVQRSTADQDQPDRARC
jgi:hypothetical protein